MRPSAPTTPPGLAVTLVIALALALTLPPAAPPVGAADLSAPLFWASPSIPVSVYSQSFQAVTFDPARPGFALAATNDPRWPIMRSADGGRTWDSLKTLALSGSLRYNLVRGAPSGTYYAYNTDVVFRTTDGGESWSRFNVSMGCGSIYGLVPHPTLASLIYTVTAGGLMRSDDGGASWFSTETGPVEEASCGYGSPVAVAAAAADNPDRVYALHDGGLRRSDDRGLTWVNAGASLPVDWRFTTAVLAQLIVDPENSDRLYLRTERAVYTTADGGSRWATLGRGLPAEELGGLARSASGELFVSTAAAVYRLAPGAPAWERVRATPVPSTIIPPRPPGVALDSSDAGRIILFGESGVLVGLPERGRVALPHLSES